jgi:NAD(P)-dependent dehydrogenase (short-subunit alcohol dehydrogenase family)
MESTGITMDTQAPLAVVTAAGGGIGSAVVRRFLAGGWLVAAVDRDAAALKRITPHGDNVLHTFVADMTREDEVNAVYDKIAALGELRVLVNGVGSVCGGGLRDLSLLEWQQGFDLNLTSVFLSTRAALPLLQRSGGDRVVVNISSTLAHVADATTLAYGAFKAALDQWTRAAALELAPEGIRVVAIAPGPVAGTAGEAHYEQQAYERFNPLGRFATTGEIAGVVAFLASEDARYITGTVIQIDGGDAALGVGWGSLPRLGVR